MMKNETEHKPDGGTDGVDCHPGHLHGEHVNSANEIITLGESLKLQIPSKPEVIEPLVMELTRRAIHSGVICKEESMGLVLSLTEAITNAVIHGNLEIASAVKEQSLTAFSQAVAERCADHAFSDRKVVVSVEDDGVRCIWEIEDEGKGFDVDAMISKIDSEEPQIELPSGRGILLMRAYMHDTSWHNGGRVVRMELQRGGSPGRSIDAIVRQGVRGHWVGTEDGKMSFDAIMTRISHHGLELLQNEQVKANRVLVELQVPDAPAEIVSADVVQMENLHGGWVKLSCRVRNAQSAVKSEHTAALTRLVNASLESSERTDERRKHKRLRFTKPVQVRLLNAMGEEAIWYTGVARDISQAGMAFVGELNIPLHTRIELIVRWEDAPMHLTGTITRSQHLIGGIRDYGIHFDKVIG